MFITLHASFEDAALGEKAMAALLDHGVAKEDLSGFFPSDFETEDVHEVRANLKHGITTTTSADAAAGAAKGAGVGLGLGAVATLASLLIPGFGLVTGGGALASALIGAAGTTVGGALAGGVAGYLEDQGVDHQVALDSEAALRHGRAVVVVRCPSGKLSEADISAILLKYHASTFGRIEAPAIIGE
ncbi:hypothetical protein ABS71_00305 [bacterium SCN 62-11]|nr:hypothetical protein [Candidatus Eremiobacteraeota bacterium]ODT81923.1 MAG: hypothetical protein ABS71_00305 [bacterium SCN 62-11]